MFGNRNFKRGNQHKQHNASLGFCVCPICGYSIPHIQGEPCNAKSCPDCKTGLVRSESSGNSTEIKVSDSSNQPTKKNTPTTIVYPIVNSELCTGCGVCIDTCPTKAIVLKEDKAFIVNDLCRNCKKCVRICPSEAIS